jgi:hypothetical protein
MASQQRGVSRSSCARGGEAPAAQLGRLSWRVPSGRVMARCLERFEPRQRSCRVKKLARVEGPAAQRQSFGRHRSTRVGLAETRIGDDDPSGWYDRQGMRWSEVAEFFSWDGSWRDIYVAGADASAWMRFLAAIPAWNLPYTYQENGESAPFPPTRLPFVGEPERSARLELSVGGATLNCHFFTEDEIELDLDPREVCARGSVDDIVSFMSQVSELVQLPAVLTSENCQTEALITVDAARGLLRWKSSSPPTLRERIYVRLLDEGTDVWRPVEAERLPDDTLRLVLDQPKEDDTEQWEFSPGDTVTCGLKRLSGGSVLVALELA